MRDVLGDPSLGIVDDGAVGRINAAQLERLQATQRRHVVEQVAVVRGNDGRRATQHDVTGEERLLLGQVVAQMIGGVTRRVDGHERDAVTLVDRKSTRLNSSHSQISYAVFCLKKKNTSLYTLLYTFSLFMSLIPTFTVNN